MLFWEPHHLLAGDTAGPPLQGSPAFREGPPLTRTVPPMNQTERGCGFRIVSDLPSVVRCAEPSHPWWPWLSWTLAQSCEVPGLHLKPAYPKVSQSSFLALQEEKWVCESRPVEEGRSDSEAWEDRDLEIKSSDGTQ